MTQFILNIITELGNHELKAHGSADVDQLLVEILSLFELSVDNVNQKISIEAVQKNTSQLQNNLIEFAACHKEISSGIWNLVKLFKSMKDGEFFCIIPSSEDLPQDLVSKVSRYLLHNNHNDAEAFESFVNEYYKFVLDNYSIIHYDNHKRISIGESVKTNRVCRYCGLKMPDVKFNKKAHTISESLGNKTIVTNDECDTCNEEFGKGIEQQLSDYIAPMRLFFGIQGKNGISKLKDGNESFSYELTNDINKKTITVGLYEKEDSSRQKWEMVESPNFSITHPNKINVQDVYRAIVKFSIGVMTAEDLEACQDTIKWVNKKVSAKKLPKVIFYLDTCYSPGNTGVTVFRRKDIGDHTIPHYFLELRVSGLIIVAIVPFTSGYEASFENNNVMQDFVGKLKPYKDLPIMKIIDGSIDEAREVKMNFSFKQRETLEEKMTDCII